MKIKKGIIVNSQPNDTSFPKTAPAAAKTHIGKSKSKSEQPKTGKFIETEGNVEKSRTVGFVVVGDGEAPTIPREEIQILVPIAGASRQAPPPPVLRSRRSAPPTLQSFPRDPTHIADTVTDIRNRHKAIRGRDIEREARLRGRYWFL